MTAGGWCVHRFDSQRSWDALLDAVVQHESDVAARAQRLGVQDGQRFVLDSNGFPDSRVNSFLASARMRNLAETTQRDYGHSLALWLNFLETRGTPWWNASIEDAEEFQFWRLTDPANASTVGTSAFSKDVAACKKYYRWGSARFEAVVDAFDQVGFPSAKREAGVKWLDSAAITRWRDVGVRGRTLAGRRDQT